MRDPIVPGLPGQPHRGAASDSQRTGASALVWLLTAVSVAALLLRCAAIAEPLGIDQSLWASAVRGMSRGQLLYRDVWEQRPPGIYWIYLAGFRVFGWSAATVVWLDILAAAITALTLADIGRRLGGRVTSAATAALYVALTMPAWLFRYGGFLERSVCETFIAVAVALTAWFAVLFVQRRSSLAAIGVGLFAGAAIVLKPNAGLYLPAIMVWMLACSWDSPGGMRTVLRPVALAAAATTILPAIALAWLWQLGLLHEARIAVVDFNRFYVAQGFVISTYAVDFAKAVWLRVKTDPLWLAGTVASCTAIVDFARTRRLAPLAGLGMLWGAAAALVIVVNGARLFNTYFLQAYPPLALMSAWLLTTRPAVDAGSPAPRGERVRSWVAPLTALMIVALLVQRSYADKVLGQTMADFAALRGTADRVGYLETFGGYDNKRGYSARANAELADYVQSHTGPDERIFLFGINGAGVYFAADRLTANRFLRVNFFVETDFPDPRFRLDAVTRDLAAARPRYVIFERLNSTSAMGRAADALIDQPDVAALLASYRLEGVIEDFTLYRRQD